MCKMVACVRNQMLTLVCPLKLGYNKLSLEIKVMEEMRQLAHKPKRKINM